MPGSARSILSGTGLPELDSAVHSQTPIKLSDGRRGFCGVVVSVGRVANAQGNAPGSSAPGEGSAVHAGLAQDSASARDSELERRLLEIGFVEGAKVEILHEGFIGRDPIAVRVDSMRVALRKREAAAIMVQEIPSGNR